MINGFLKRGRNLLILLAFPAATQAMTFDEARHLLSRTGFGGRGEEIRQLMRHDYTPGVDRLLNQTHQRASVTPPSWIDEPLPFRQMRKLSPDKRRAYRKKITKRWLELKAWWYQEMLVTDSPLTEHMTLFWHNHFTSSLRKVKWPNFMHQQNALLRKHALGNFRELLHAISRDPAMVLYLDNQTNRIGRPNENFAREVLELFTLGEGHYTETDIKEAARAFTGWHVNRRKGRFRIRHWLHDDGIKTFLGRQGNFDGDDIIDIILQQPQTATYITTKLWKEFVSEKPDPKEIERLANLFRKNDYELKPLLRAILLSPAFRDPRNRGTLVKSPVELVVGTLRGLKVPVAKPERLAIAGRYLGQDILDPPNVKGWKGGNAWITTTTLLARQDLIRRFSRGKEMGRRAMPVMSKSMSGEISLKESAVLDEQARNMVVRVMLPITPITPLPDDVNLREAILFLIQDPVYQLK